MVACGHVSLDPADLVQALNQALFDSARIEVLSGERQRAVGDEVGPSPGFSAHAAAGRRTSRQGDAALRALSAIMCCCSFAGFVLLDGRFLVGSSDQ